MVIGCRFSNNSLFVIMSSEKGEVICISSDDDEETEQNGNTGKHESKYSVDISHVKTYILKDKNESVEDWRRKRKASNISKDFSTAESRTKVFLSERGSSIEVHNVGRSFNYIEQEKDKEENSEKDKKVLDKEENNEKDKKVLDKEENNEKGQLKEADQNGQDENGRKILSKPKLIVKEKKSISEVEQDIFPMFISLCLQRDRSEDMKIIVNKLKRRYEQLDPIYANSEAFINFLNVKRNDIMCSKNKLYVYIAEVMNEMKDRCKGNSILLLNGKTSASSMKKLSSNTNSNVLNVSSASTSHKISGKASGTDSEENEVKDDATQRKINILLKTMKKCEKYIKKFEEAEINFDEENNSNYIKLERYKRRMVELYNKYCEYTGENADAGRPYLRPKHFSTTGIVAVDQAITSFINSKISKRHKLEKVGAFANALIFPDYGDILECVTACNELHNLGLDNKKQQQIAKKAFVDLGEYLQRARHNDYWDTFSLFLENEEDDPAAKDPELTEKLINNKREGEKRLANVFQEFVEKQEKMKDKPDGDTSSESEEDENESIDHDDEDNNNEDDNISEDHVSLDVDKDKTSSDEDGNSTDRDETSANKSGISNIPNVNETDSYNINVDEKLLTNTDDTVRYNSSSNVKSINTDSNVTVPNCNGYSKPEPVKRNDATPLSDTVSPASIVSPNVTLSTTAVKRVSINATEEDESNVVSEELTDSKPQKEGKPLLRVRSFAKPPTTWEDVQQKGGESSTNESIQKTLINTGIVDLTVDTQKENSTVTRCATIQIGSKILPIVKGKYKTLVIPTGKSIINVKNITNNYVRLNTQNLDPSNTVKLQTGEGITTFHPAVGTNNESTLVNQTKNLQAKQKSTIVRINQPNKMILLSTKQKENTLQPTRTNPSASKSK